MAESILLLALMALSFYYWRKENKRKQHEDWIYHCRQCLVRTARNFRHDCQDAADIAFAQYSSHIQHNYRPPADMRYLRYSFLESYRNSLDTLKEDYLKNMNEKVKETTFYTFTSVPDFLFEEYSKLITDIYNTFYDFEWRMHEQLWERE